MFKTQTSVLRFGDWVAFCPCGLRELESPNPRKTIIVIYNNQRTVRKVIRQKDPLFNQIRGYMLDYESYLKEI